AAIERDRRAGGRAVEDDRAAVHAAQPGHGIGAGHVDGAAGVVHGARAVDGGGRVERVCAAIEAQRRAGLGGVGAGAAGAAVGSDGEGRAVGDMQDTAAVGDVAAGPVEALADVEGAGAYQVAAGEGEVLRVHRAVDRDGGAVYAGDARAADRGAVVEQVIAL